MKQGHTYLLYCMYSIWVVLLVNICVVLGDSSKVPTILATYTDKVINESHFKRGFTLARRGELEGWCSNPGMAKDFSQEICVKVF